MTTHVLLRAADLVKIHALNGTEVKTDVGVEIGSLLCNVLMKACLCVCSLTLATLSARLSRLLSSPTACVTYESLSSGTAVMDVTT